MFTHALLALSAIIMQPSPSSGRKSDRQLGARSGISNACPDAQIIRSCVRGAERAKAFTAAAAQAAGMVGNGVGTALSNLPV